MSNKRLSEDQIKYEFSLTPSDFNRIRKLIREHAGISLPLSKQGMVYSRLARRLRVNGLRNFKEYLDFLAQGDAIELEAFVNALTTNTTAFFREEHHFPMLKQHIEQRKNKNKIHIWCSASSTGEEAYSIAMTMVKFFKSLTPPVHILATDLNAHVLDKAAQGVYLMNQLDKFPRDYLKAFFLKGTNQNSGLIKVRQELKNMVTFRKLNLLDDHWPVRGNFDIIFCRNVMIYFDKETQYKILQRFAPLLTEDGLLFAGHSESFLHARNLFRLREKTVYELSGQRNAPCD
ncbi:MCP methyltransferase, CheR-type [Nitrosomonas cryotolerans]|uniref:Chemotaxis protein methyltransferase n=1 Tax=Nitrosomonas cryotolerans ATCC 49181 TaxID=1131553 RepID=A0A1N6I6R4_9PROT|nr:CheR family methyltransferase [Nitrosomonas cryotolerans]SFP91104.1 MCP methyltransferase, CheR-type [Nitrosomonas cryotolerans]SIO27693.1 chemotaxis protein methyltransferase CheR [Nitrosomonas cryotolerans ATCC 49181]